MVQKAPEISGLTEEQVKKNFNRGNNYHFSLRSNRSYWQIISANVFSIYNIILVAPVLGVILLKGSRDVLLSAGLVGINIAIGLYKEIRAKHLLDKLAVLNAPVVHVRRNQASYSIPVRELVYGDIVELYSGEPIVADGRILFSDSLELDESSLTGESEGIPKKMGDFLTSGSYCLAGFGLMRAEKVGKASSLYDFTLTAKTFRIPQTEFENLLKKLFQILLFILLLLAPFTLVNGLLQNLSLSESLTNVVNVISSLIPQGMIMSMTILFAYGIINISRYQTLIQRTNAVAIMGNVTVLCADKTGTLTTNSLELKEIIPQNKLHRSDINSQLSLYVQNVSWKNKTLYAVSAFLDKQDKTKHFPFNKISETPFTSDRKWGSIVFDTGVLVMGAPEILSSDKEILRKVSSFAKKGLRVVAFAKSPQLNINSNSLPRDMSVIALLAFKDQLRDDVKKTIDNLHQQNISFKIISGDSADTIQSIAYSLHLPLSELYDQNFLEAAGEERFRELVKRGSFFARITPSMKERIITELVRQGEVVAMIGDGVNDVRALKKSHIAIAVNDGAQITKDVADIILLNNSFSVLPKAIDEGRDITRRVYAVAKIFFVKVIYLVTLFISAGIANLPFPISLRQTTWLGFIVVGVPTALIAFKLLTPASIIPTQKSLIRYILTAGILGGLVMSAIMIVVQLILKEDSASSRTQVGLFAALYSMLILFQIHGISFFSFTSIRKHLNSFILLLLIGGIAIFIPRTFIHGVFQFTDFDYTDWILVAFGIAGSIGVLHFLLRKINTLGTLNK